MTGDLITSARAQDNLNNYVESTNEYQTLTDLITSVSRSIKKFCKRDFVATNYDELYNGNGQRRMLLHRFPILAVSSVRYRPVTVMIIINNDQLTNQRANVAVTCKPLKAGEKVTIQAEVISLYPTEPIINLKVRLLEPRPTNDSREYRLLLHPLENRDTEEPMNPALSYIYARLSEPSTRRGIIALLTASGLALSPNQVDKIVARH